MYASYTSVNGRNTGPQTCEKLPNYGLVYELLIIYIPCDNDVIVDYRLHNINRKVVTAVTHYLGSMRTCVVVDLTSMHLKCDPLETP